MPLRLKYMGAARSFTVFDNIMTTKMKAHLDTTPVHCIAFQHKINICAEAIDLAFVKEFIKRLPSPDNTDVVWAVERMRCHIKSMEINLSIAAIVPSTAKNARSGDTRSEKTEILLRRLVHYLDVRGGRWAPNILHLLGPPKTLEEIKQAIFGLKED